MYSETSDVASDFQATPIEFSPDVLKQFEKELSDARTKGREKIQFNGCTVVVGYGEILACAVRNKFMGVYGIELSRKILGEAPQFALNYAPESIEQVIPGFSLPITKRIRKGA